MPCLNRRLRARHRHNGRGLPGAIYRRRLGVCAAVGEADRADQPSLTDYAQRQARLDNVSHHERSIRQREHARSILGYHLPLIQGEGDIGDAIEGILDAHCQPDDAGRRLGRLHAQVEVAIVAEGADTLDVVVRDGHVGRVFQFECVLRPVPALPVNRQPGVPVWQPRPLLLRHAQQPRDGALSQQAVAPMQWSLRARVDVQTVAVLDDLRIAEDHNPRVEMCVLAQRTNEQSPHPILPQVHLQRRWLRRREDFGVGLAIAGQRVEQRRGVAAQTQRLDRKRARAPGQHGQPQRRQRLNDRVRGEVFEVDIREGCQLAGDRLMREPGRDDERILQPDAVVPVEEDGQAAVRLVSVGGERAIGAGADQAAGVNGQQQMSAARYLHPQAGKLICRQRAQRAHQDDHRCVSG